MDEPPELNPSPSPGGSFVTASAHVLGAYEQHIEQLSLDDQAALLNASSWLLDLHDKYEKG